MYQLPIIRLELENMKHHVVHALGRHSHEIESHVEEQLTKAIEAFDFEAIVREVSEQAIKESVRVSIESYFRYGDGHKAIQDMIAKAFATAQTGHDKPA